MSAGTTVRAKCSFSRAGTSPVPLALVFGPVSGAAPLSRRGCCGGTGSQSPGQATTAPGLWEPVPPPWAREFRLPLPWSLTLVDRLAAAPAHAGLAAVGQHRESGPRRLVAAAADGQHVGQRQRSLALDDAALPQLLRRTLVLLEHVDVFDHHAALLGQ